MTALLGAAAMAQPPTQPAPLTGDCAQLEAQSTALKAELREVIGNAPAQARAQAAGQGASAGVALAGQAVASVVGVVGVAISQGALEVHKQQARSGLAKADRMMTEAVPLSRQIQAIEAEREKRCAAGAAK